MRLYSKIVTIALILIFAGNQGINAQGIVNDIDGNVYLTVVIGAQEWLGENLKVTRYNNGEPILTDQTADQWRFAAEGIWTYYEGDFSNNDKYGKLYNWHTTVDTRGLCPDGWRVPTDNDWQILTEFIHSDAWGNFNTLGANLKSRRQVNSPLGGEFNTSEHPRWDSHPKIHGVDAYGFGALPGGSYTMGKAFVHKGQYAYFWSTTERENGQVWVRSLMNSNTGMSRGQYLKNLGKSVRCVKGETQNFQVPQVITLPLTSITTTSAKSGGDVLSDGGSPVTGRGLVWGTSANPTIDSNLGDLPSGSGLGVFNETISGLDQGSVYWVRAYATNEVGTAYGTQKKIETIGEVIPSYTLTLNANPINGGTVTGEGDYSEGKVVTITATPAPGYVFMNWSEEVAEALEATTTFTMPAKDITLVANFEEEIIAGNTIVVNDLEAEAGSEITIEVEMNNQGDIIAFQMDFELPDGFTYVEGSYTLSNRSQGHTPGQSILTNGKLRVLAYSAANNIFLGKTGILFTFKLKSPVQTGIWIINATNVILTNTNFENVFDGEEGGEVTLYETTASWTPCLDMPTVTDIDGNIYKTMQIGGQCWIDENLKTTKYSNGTPIPTGYTNAEWAELFTGAFSIYPHTSLDGFNSDAEVFEAYGALYNGYAFETGNLCPTGWTVPTDAQWSQLINFIDPSSIPDNWPESFIVGGKLKSTHTAPNAHPRWESPNIGVTDEFGFSAFPGGFRASDGNFNNIGYSGYWWSTTEIPPASAWYRVMDHSGGHIGRVGSHKQQGFSVRCIKD